jgi:nucleoside-diphosphate-sugar epimerase
MPEDGYGWEKLFSERMCRHFREDYGMKTRVARFHNVYGPHGTWEGGREKAPAAICRKVIRAKLAGDNAIEIWGDGTQTRSFMYITDCLKGIQMITTADFTEPINLGSSELVSINQLVSIAEEIAGIRLNRTYKLDAPRGVAGRNSDNTLMREVHGWEPDTRLRDGMEKTYRWIYDEYIAEYGDGPTPMIQAPARRSAPKKGATSRNGVRARSNGKVSKSAKRSVAARGKGKPSGKQAAGRKASKGARR